MFIGGSAAINGATAWHLGDEQWQRYVFAGIVVGAVICEALGVLFVRHHWRTGNRLLALAGVSLMIAAAAYTVRMELRFFTLSHAGTSVKSDAKIQDRRDIDADIAQARRELSWIPKHRLVGVVQADLTSLRAKYKGAAEKYCAMKARWAGKVCRQMKALVSELAIARQAIKLKSDIQQWSKAKRIVPVVAEAMPEAAWLSRRLPVSRDGATDWLMIGGILFLLLGRTFALPLAMTDVPSSKKRTQVASLRENGDVSRVPDGGAGDNEDASYVPIDGANDNGDASYAPEIGKVLTFPKHVPKNSLDQFIYLLRDAGGSSMSFPEIWAEYKRFCKRQGVKLEARNYVGKRLQDLGFSKDRPKPRNGSRVTVYQIPPFMTEAA
jgi:hypothetical protein